MKASRLPIAPPASPGVPGRAVNAASAGRAVAVRRATCVIALGALVFAGVLCLNIRSALAGETRPLIKTFGFGTLAAPSGIAIDETKSNVLVADGDTEVVDVFGLEGEAPSGVSVTEIPGFAFAEEPSGVAVDNSASSPSKGAVYVTDVKHNVVKKFKLNASHEYELQEELNATPGLGEPIGVAVNASGDVFVGDYGSRSVVEFSPTGVELQRISTSPGGSPSDVAIDPAGDLYVQIYGSGEVKKYIANGAGEVTSSSAEEQIVAAGATGITFAGGKGILYVAMGDHIAAYSAGGALEGEFGAGQLGSTQRMAIDPASEDLYVVDRGHGDVAIFGPSVTVPSVHLGAASSVAAAKATLNGSVDPEGVAVESCFFEYGETTSYGQTAPCKGAVPTDSEFHPVSANISGLTPNNTLYHYRLVVQSANGAAHSTDRTFSTADNTVSAPATAIAPTSATLHGFVRPEEVLFSDCKFEYGPTTSASFESTAPCSPAAAEIAVDEEAHDVSASVTGLQPNTTYRFRLTATNSQGTSSGEVETFTTTGPPQISEIRAADADHSSVTLEAKIDPDNFGTSYRFEWGSTTSYGNSVPIEFEPYVGEGETPVLVSAKLSGLSAGGTYHYRVLARSKAGTTRSPDQIFETLDSCGLPEKRCFELVSPRDAGPLALPGVAPTANEFHFQAANRTGSLAYPVESGLPSATKGAEVLYQGTRGANGWTTSQLSAPILAQNETVSTYSTSATFEGLSENLECGVLESNQPLTSDASTRLVREAGGANLYRRNPDGSYTAITTLVPENLGTGDGNHDEYQLRGFSADCNEVVFESEYRYPGVEAVAQFANDRYLYEWREGRLKGVGFVPGPNGEEAVEAAPGAGSYQADTSNIVSSDGSRVFFSAGGIFVREDGTTTRDLSLSETSTPDTSPRYQYATKDGSHAFFTANAGLTQESSAEGTDLYEYDLDTQKLTDLSVDHQEGAEVEDFVGASEDGSHVYFVARGQLVPGEGRTLAQNRSANTYSLYGEQGGLPSFVATVGLKELRAITLEQGLEEQTARVSPDGRYLLFDTNRDVTGYESGDHVSEAYLYDAEAVSGAITCVSCRQDGEASVTSNGRYPLHAEGAGNDFVQLATLTESEGAAEVYFTSADDLAAGAVEGLFNLYEWTHGQVFLIATEPPNLKSPNSEEPSGEGYTLVEAEEHVTFAGSSPEGTDLYFATPQTMNSEDGDSRWSIYDARVGGGFAEPVPPANPCDADAESSCQSASSPPPALAGSASSKFEGPGNAVAPAEPSIAPTKPKLTRAQQLSRAIKACHRYKAKTKRVSCEKQARSQYGAKHKPKAKSHKGGK